MKVLVIGGTGPTGPFVVNGLVERGHEVTILHTGRHEVESLPPENVVAHIHADPFDEGAFSASLEGLSFDVVISMYGRLRMIAAAIKGKTGRLISIGGTPIYSGFIESEQWFPQGLPVPTREDAPLVGSDDSRKLQAIRTAEDTVFTHHPTATHFRYPGIYGANQVMPLQWPIVKRALDGRRHLIVADGGLQLLTMIYAENAAHAVLLAVDQPENSLGQIYNVSDDRLFTVAQVIQIIADELNHEFDLVSLPYGLAKSAWPVLGHHASEHRVLDASKIRDQLGYRDIVDPVEGMRRTIRWQVDTLGKDSAVIDARLQDPYDYNAEDDLVRLYTQFEHDAQQVEYTSPPGWTIAYYGSRPNPAGRDIGIH